MSVNNPYQLQQIKDKLDLSQIQKQSQIESNVSELEYLNSHLAQQRFQLFQSPYDQYSKIIGVLHSQWLTQKKQILRTLFGTAFAINPKTIITCTHNIYSNAYQKFADKIRFVRGTQFGDRLIVAKNIHGAQIVTKNQIGQLKFAIEPDKEQLSVLKLEQQLFQRELVFPVLGNLNLPTQQNAKYKIVAMGYPSSDNPNRYLYEKDQFQLSLESGTIHSLNDFILNYAMKTGSGLDGSPLFVEKQNGDILVVGIHTHSQAVRRMYTNEVINYGSGLHFSPEILKNIGQEVQKINQLAKVNHRVLYKLAQLPQLYEVLDQNQQIKLNKMQQSNEKQRASQTIQRQKRQKQKLIIQKWQKETAQIQERINNQYLMFEMSNADEILLQQKDYFMDWPASNNKKLQRNWPYLSIKLGPPSETQEVLKSKQERKSFGKPFF